MYYDNPNVGSMGRTGGEVYEPELHLCAGCHDAFEEVKQFMNEDFYCEECFPRIGQCEVCSEYGPLNHHEASGIGIGNDNLDVSYCDSCLEAA